MADAPACRDRRVRYLHGGGMTNDPCDEWPVIFHEGRLKVMLVETLSWLHTSTDKRIISWRRMDEDESGDTLYECFVLKDIEPSPSPSFSTFAGLTAAIDALVEQGPAFAKAIQLALVQDMTEVRSPPLIDIDFGPNVATSYRVHEYGGKRWRKPK